MNTTTPPRDDVFNTPLPPHHDECHPVLFAEVFAERPALYCPEPGEALLELAFIDRPSLEFKLS